VLVLDLDVPCKKSPHTSEALWRKRRPVAVGLVSTSIAERLSAFSGLLSPRLDQTRVSTQQPSGLNLAYAILGRDLATIMQSRLQMLRILYGELVVATAL
jgi:hypothetical protein